MTLWALALVIDKIINYISPSLMDNWVFSKDYTIYPNYYYSFFEIERKKGIIIKPYVYL